MIVVHKTAWYNIISSILDQMAAWQMPMNDEKINIMEKWYIYRDKYDVISNF